MILGVRVVGNQSTNPNKQNIIGFFIFFKKLISNNKNQSPKPCEPVYYVSMSLIYDYTEQPTLNFVNGKILKIHILF